MTNKLTTATSFSLAVCAAVRVISQRGLLILLNSTMAVATTCALVGVLNAQQPNIDELQQEFQSDLKKAFEGNSSAQVRVGYAYQKGEGVKDDRNQAVAWYRKAALQGNRVGQYNLGVMYEFGAGVEKNLEESKQWYRKAAEQDHRNAQYKLGIVYEEGKGTKKDLKQAVEWHRKAAEQGHARAQSRLGYMYEYGKGVEKDLKQAVAWYRKAAEQGDLQAKEEFLYLSGKINGPSFLQRELQQSLKKEDSLTLVKELRTFASVLDKLNLDIERAEALSRALAIQEKTHGNRSIKTTPVRTSLAVTQGQLGNQKEKLNLQQENAEIVKDKYGTSSFQYANSLYQLGKTHQILANHHAARQCYQECIDAATNANWQDRKELNIYNSEQDFVKEHTGYFARLGIAESYYAEQKFEQALSALETCIGQIEAGASTKPGGWVVDVVTQGLSIAGDEHVLKALILTRMGHLEKAAIHFEKNGNMYYSSAVFAYLALAAESEKVEERFQAYIIHDADGSHGWAPGLSRALRAYADYCAFTNQWKKAVSIQNKARQGITRYAIDRLPRLTEIQRRSFIEQEYLPSLYKALTVALAQADNPRATALSAGWLINGKAVTEEALAEASLLSSEEAYPTVRKLSDVREQLAALSVNADIKDLATKKRLANLEAEETQLQNELSKFKLGGSFTEEWVSVGNVIASLTDESSFITVAKIRPFDIRKTYTSFRLTSLASTQSSDVWLSEKYVAWVVPPLGLGNVQCIDLGDAKKIDKAITKVRNQLTRVAAEMENANEAKLETELKSELGNLSKLVLDPLAQYIEDADELIISPDGELWTIPWELLHDGTSDGEYLIENKRIRYVSSGRALIRKLQPRSVVGSPVIFANPNYDLAASKLQTEKTPQFPLRGLKSKLFPALVSSAAEAKAIAPSIKEFADAEPKLLTSFSALESEFKKLHRPKVLAISTHGYFEQNKRIKNPLLRCGLALAGANNRQQAMAEGKEDGILTGLEIVGTDLRGTELVVLSACETGLGEVTSGEGVAGLRQAFQLAGAQSVVSVSYTHLTLPTICSV